MFIFDFLPKFLIDKNQKKKENTNKQEYKSIVREKKDIGFPYLNIKNNYLQLSTEKIKGNPIRIKKNKKEYTILNKKQDSSIKINNNSSVTTTVKNTVQVPINKVGDGILTVKSSNNNIATATINGNNLKIQTDKSGTATITVSMAESKYYNSCYSTIKVTSNRYQSSISLSRTSLTLTDSSSNNTITVYKSGNGNISIDNSNSNCVSSSFNGTNTITVNGIKTGTATITASISQTDYYSGASTSITITSNVHEKITKLPYTFTANNSNVAIELCGWEDYKKDDGTNATMDRDIGDNNTYSGVKLSTSFSDIRAGSIVTVNSFSNSLYKTQKIGNRNQTVYNMNLNITVKTNGSSSTKTVLFNQWASYDDNPCTVSFKWLYVENN